MSEIIHFIVTATKYEGYLKEHYFQDHVARWGNIGELISVAKKQPTVAEEDYSLGIDEVIDVNGENITLALGINGVPNDVDFIDMADISTME